MAPEIPNLTPKRPVSSGFKLGILLLVIGLLAAIILATRFGPHWHLPTIVTTKNPSSYYVTHVVDGDTLDVRDSLGQTDIVRLLGIDTPETKDPRKQVQCYGHEAAAKTKALAEGKSVTLVADPTDSDRDKYHRLLRYVYLPDGTFLNARLVQDGYAFAYTVFPIQKLDQFRQLQADARSEKRGLWGTCTVNESSKIKQTNSL